MPTWAECQELLDKCTWTWIAYNGVLGQKVTGPNGNSIFLPAAGCYRDLSVLNRGKYGTYWFGTLYEDDGLNSNAYYLSFNYSYLDWHYCARSCGLSIRPVSE